MSVSDLAERTGLAINTIRKAEKTNGQTEINSANAKLLISTLESAGVIFIAADALGSGVRLRTDDVVPLRFRRG